MARNNISIVIGADARQALSELGRVESAVGTMSQRVGQKMQSVGRTLTAGITLPLAAVGGVSIAAASDLEESLSKVGQVFGGSAGDIETWSEDSATAFGLSQQKALEAAGTFGNLFSAMGLGIPESAELSTELVELAADLASFNNISTDEALEKLRAGLVGEVEPLRSLGVQLSAAAVQAKAMEMGLADADGAVSESAKVQARYALILEHTENAQGDFARTSDGLANQQRIMKARFEDLSAEIGTRLLPIASRLVDWASRMMDWFNRLPGGAQDVIVVVGGIAAAIGPLLWIGGKLVAGFGAIKSAFMALTAVMAANPYVALAIATIAIVTLIVMNWDKIKAFLSATWDAIKGGLEAAWNGIKDFFVRFWPILLGVFTGGIGTIVAFVILKRDEIVGFFQDLPGNIVDALSSFGRTVWNGIKKSVGEVVDKFEEIVGEILEFHLELPGRIVDGIANIGTVVWNGILASLAFLKDAFFLWIEGVKFLYWDLPRRIIDGIVQIGVTIWNGIVGSLLSLAQSVGGFISDVVGIFLSMPGRIISGLATIGQRVWDGIVKPLFGLALNVGEFISNVVGIFLSMPGRIVSGLETLFVGVADFFRSIGRRMVEWIIDGIVNAPSIIGALLNKIPGFSGLSSFVGGLLGSIPGLAAGGPVKADQLYVVGEKGPELFAPSIPGTILPNGSTFASIHRSDRPSTSVMNVTVNMPPGSDGQDVVNALIRWSRNNGPLPVDVSRVAA